MDLAFLRLTLAKTLARGVSVQLLFAFEYAVRRPLLSFNFTLAFFLLNFLWGRTDSLLLLWGVGSWGQALLEALPTWPQGGGWGVAAPSAAPTLCAAPP